MAHHDATGTPRPPFRDATSVAKPFHDATTTRKPLYRGCDTHTGQPEEGERYPFTPNLSPAAAEQNHREFVALGALVPPEHQRTI
jgi:hypothetical protein